MKSPNRIFLFDRSRHRRGICPHGGGYEVRCRATLVVGIGTAMAVIAATAVISAVSIIATTVSAVISATPVTVIPRIVAGPEIDRGSTVIIRAGIVGITAVISRADPDSYPNMHSGIGLAGEAQHSQQRND